MMHRRLRFLILGLLAASLPGLVAAFPGDAELEYRIQRSGITVGTLKRSISPLEAMTGKEFRVDSVARPEGVARLLLRGETREVARFQLHNDQIRPLHYLYRQRTGDKKDVELTFHWEERRVRERHSGEEWELEDGTQDLVSAQFAIIHGVARGERSFHFTLASDNGLDDYHYMVVGREVIETPAGSFLATKVQRMRDDPDRRHNIFWLAHDLDYLPVHIEERRKGRRIMVLSLTSGPDQPSN